MIRIKTIINSCLAVCLLLFACDGKRHTEVYAELDYQNGWTQDSVICFETMEIENLNTGYNFLISMRHTTEFKYRNMYFFVDIESPEGKIVRDTAELILQDRNGFWYGEGNGFLRSIKEHNINGLYKRNVALNEKGVYKVCIQHGMRDERLKNITDIGIRVEYVN